MRTLTVQSADLSELQRLDAYFHLSDGRHLAKHATTGTIRHSRFGDKNIINARVWMPGRLKHVYAAKGENSQPYLRPSDTLNYIPRAADYISKSRTPNIDTYAITSGMILITRSGRNLGPVIYVDNYLSQFVLSDDMLRVEIKDENLRFYCLALLASPTGQKMLRKNKSGSVIDHITADHVLNLDIPLLNDDIANKISEKMREAAVLREGARLELSTLERNFEARLPPLPTSVKKSRGWTLSSDDFNGRIDAAPYDPEVKSISQALKEIGGKPLSANAQALKPSGRYKTVYVDSDNGMPILSGGQLLQIRPLNQKYIAKSALHGVDRYQLKRNWIAYQADGRSEETLGEPVMITHDRENWLASGHVGRLVTKEGINPGSVYLAFQTLHAQIQLKSLCSGSVVDATFPEDAESIILPPLSEEAGKAAEKCWDQFTQALQRENDAIAEVEMQLHDAWRLK